MGLIVSGRRKGVLQWAGAAWCFPRSTSQLRATLKTLLGLLSLSRVRTSARKNSRSTTRVKSQRRNRRGKRNFLAASPIRKRFHGCGIASSSLSETFNGPSGSVRSDACINLFPWPQSGELLRKGEEKNRKARAEVTALAKEVRTVAVSISADNLFGRSERSNFFHVKNNIAESVLLEQRDYVRHPLDTAWHGATHEEEWKATVSLRN